MRIILFVTLWIFTSQAFSQTYQDYAWKNAPIGGGGYITGMQIHPLDSAKRYYRTDVGGAYRWDNQTQRMEQMVFATNKSFYSVAGIALHPTNTNIVYLAVGYTCNKDDSAILKSTDGGVTFTKLPLSGETDIYFAANGGRECKRVLPTDNDEDKDRQGTPIAINPLNTNELYVGSRENGLFTINLTTLLSTHVDSLKIPTNSDKYSIRSVKFHPTQPFVYISYSNHGLYVGNTNTSTFTNYYDANSSILSKLKDAIGISISKNADYMLIACKTKGILKATNLTGTLSFSESSNLNPADDEGYLTVTCSPHDNNVAITVVTDWNHINEFQVSTNSGTSFTQISGSVSAADNVFPWRKDTFASHVAQIAFDPISSSKVHYTSWFSTFQCNNFTTTGPLVWSNSESKGHEEIVPTDLVAFPSTQNGNFLMSGSGDHSGFMLDNGLENKDNFATTHISENIPGLGDLKRSASFDFCEDFPENQIVAITDKWTGSNGAILSTNNGGTSWSLLPGYTSAWAKSLVAYSSTDPLNIVALSTNGIKYTLDKGATSFLQAGTNLPASSTCTFPFNVSPIATTTVGAGSLNHNIFASYKNIIADKNYGCVFYFYDWNGHFSISTDGGQNWGVINTTDLPASNNNWHKTRIISIPDKDGHLWINANNELYKSTDAGQNWSHFSATNLINKVKAISFGKGFNSAYPAMYVYGNTDNDNTLYLFRSDDEGQNWIRINEHSEKELWNDIKILAGDRNIAGRVYAAVSGQGVIYGNDLSVTETCNNIEKTLDGEFNTLNSPSIPNWTTNAINGAAMAGTTNNWTKAVLNITNPGINFYDLQLWQDNLSMQANILHKIQLNLRADTDRQVVIKLRNRTNGTTYFEKTIDITATAQEYAFLFKPLITDNDLRLTLMVGTQSPTVYVDHIKFAEFCQTDYSQIDCIDNLYLANHEIIPFEYKTAKKIESVSIINGETNFSAGNQILLSPGFKTENSSVFEAEIIGCP